VETGTRERVWRDRTTTGVILLNEQGHALLQLRDNIPTIADPNCWAIPGGEARPGEDPAAAARREFFEETGYQIKPDDLTFVVQRDVPRPQGTTEHRYCYTAMYDGVQPIECHEGQAMRFIDPADLPSLPTSPGISEIVVLTVERFGP
jgi:8-oxo-dGTP pyrophosphatase MutT (NUDIX family)